MKYAACTAALALGSLLAAGNCRADLLAITPIGLNDSLAPYSLTTGWGFAVTQTLTITALDYYDAGQDGLVTSHDVGLFSQSGTLLLSATIPAGTTAALNTIYRSVAVAPYTLAPGNYVMAGFTGPSTDPYLFDSSGGTTIPGVTLTPSAYLAFDSSLAFPTGNLGNYRLSANFEASSGATAPEPGFFAATFGLLAVLLICRRMRPVTPKTGR